MHWTKHSLSSTCSTNIYQKLRQTRTDFIGPNKKAKITPGKRATAPTAVCVWRLVFVILLLFEAPSWGTSCDINAIYTSLKSTFPSLTIRVYLQSFSCCCLQNTKNIAKFQQNLTLQQFKVIQGHRSWCQWKAHMWLPIGNFSRISYLFRDITLNDRKLLILFYPPLLCLTLPLGGTP